MKGPHLQIVASCHGCDHARRTPSTSSHYAFTECDHPRAPPRPSLENTHLRDSTPQWCPLLESALADFTRGNPQHRVNS